MSSINNGLSTAPNERTSLLQSRDPESPSRATKPPTAKDPDTFIIYATFLGVFIASVDESLVLSTYSTIASQFHHLAIGSWLIVAYNFGYCISLPVYGALSDSYGRKNVLLVSYFLFILACLACGTSISLPQLIVARVFAGLGGSGMVSQVSIIIMDIVPARDVAMYRSYENVVNCIGRSMGAPIGGLLLETMGWRWSFFGQVPFILVSCIIAWYGLPASPKNGEETSRQTRIRDIDFAGLITFTTSIITLLLLLQAVGMKNDSHFLGVWTLALTFVLSSSVFVATEAFLIKKPLIPVNLLIQRLGAYCLLQVLIFSGRMAFVSNVAPYFIRVMGTSDFVASATYAMMVIGVSIGCVFSGFVIKRTRRYKTMSIIAIFLTILTFFLIFLTWRDGCTWESLFLFLVGFAPGILFSSLFIGMSQSSPKEHSSICVATYYLCQQLGIIIGPTCGSALVQWLFRGNLANRLGDIPHKKQVINDVLNDSRFQETLPETLQQIVRSSYLDSFQYIPVFAIVTNLAMLPIFMFLKEEKLE